MSGILLAGFDGVNNPARIVVEKSRAACSKLIIPNDKDKSVEILLNEIWEKEAACVVIVGRKPCIKDKIAVEPFAKGEGGVLRTPLDVTSVVNLIKKQGYNAYISKGCGNSYCNHIYYNCIASGVNCIFLHIPVFSCISDTDALSAAVDGFINGLGGVPALL